MARTAVVDGTKGSIPRVTRDIPDGKMATTPTLTPTQAALDGIQQTRGPRLDEIIAQYKVFSGRHDTRRERGALNYESEGRRFESCRARH
jgi:hypothetical protein